MPFVRLERLPRALLDDPSVLEHDDPVGVTDGRQAVRDDDVVRPRAALISACWTSCSDTESRCEVASSSTRMPGLRTIARAIAMRWRWPPETIAPRSPTSVSSPSGSEATISARLAAAIARSSAPSVDVLPAVEHVLAQRAVEEERVLLDQRDRAMPALRRELPVVAPSTAIRPAVGTRSRISSDASVDFPDPDLPTSATVCPARISKSTSLSACVPVP